MADPAGPRVLRLESLAESRSSTLSGAVENPGARRHANSTARAADLVHRALYRALLARLPERAAVPLGQAALRGLPLGRSS